MLSKIFKWLKKYWWAVLIIPTILLVVYYVFRFLVSMATDGVLDMSELDKKLRDDLEEMNRQERDVMDKIIKERDELWKKIDQGDPTPSKIFDEEITS